MRLLLKRPICLLFFIFSVHSYGQWTIYTTQNSQLPDNFVTRIIIDKDNIKWVATLSGMVKINGNSWIIFDTTNTPFLNNGIVPMTMDRSNNLWVSVAYSGVAKYNGATWTIYDTLNSGLPSNRVANISIDSNGTKWMATSKGIAKFNDTTWTIYNTTNSGLPSNTTSKIAIENNIKWIGTYSFTGGMAKFDDGSWIVYNTSNSELPSNLVRDIEIDILGNKWIATYFGGLAKFSSLHNQWTLYNSTNSGLPENFVLTVITDNYKKWIGTEGSGLVYYNDTSWIVFNPSNSPLPGYGVSGLALDTNNRLWICCEGGLAVYNSNLIGISSNHANIPLDFVLHQNYPNPFNPGTKIRYELKKSGKVKLEIFDITGKKYLTLLNKKQSVGFHEVEFNGESFPSGVYFYRLEVGTENTDRIYYDVKKMILLK